MSESTKTKPVKGKAAATTTALVPTDKASPPPTQVAKSPVGKIDITARQFAELAVKSALFKDTKDQYAAVAKMVLGASMGIDPATALQNIIIVQGKISFTANLIAARIKQSGRYRYEVMEKSDKQCVIQFFEKIEDWTADGKQIYKWIKPGPPEVFSLDMAKRAGLLQQNAKVWNSYVEAMLFNRCLTAGSRTYTPDVMTGTPIYTPEELDPTAAVTVNQDGELVVEVSDSPADPTPEPVAEAEIVTVDPKLLGKLTDLIASTKADPAALLKYYKRKSIADLSTEQVVHGIGLLEQKARAPECQTAA